MWTDITSQFWFIPAMFWPAPRGAATQGQNRKEEKTLCESAKQKEWKSGKRNWGETAHSKEPKYINSCHVLFFWVSLRPFRHDFKKISKFSSDPARPSIIISCPLEIVSRKKNKRKRNYWRSWRKLPNSVGRTPGFKENLTGKRFAKEDSSWRRRAREEFTEQNEILRRKRRRCET